jgi:signal transduction histidine kinase
VRGGLTLRLVAASAVLAAVIGGAFVVMLSSVAQLRELQRQAHRSEQVLVVANVVERLVIDLESGQRGFVITGEDNLLQPWRSARDAIPDQLTLLTRLVADNPDQHATARGISTAIDSYVRDYSVPLVALARRDPAAARTVAVTEEGERRLDVVRKDVDRFVATENTLADRREDGAAAADHRAAMAAGVGLVGSLLLVAAFGAYLTIAIAKPIRRAAGMANRIAGGDLDSRLPERGPGEVGALQHSFNTMAGSLQHSRAELAASRARIVTAADQERRRIERDLHDGIQQRLVSLVLDLRGIEADTDIQPGPEGDIANRVSRVADHLVASLDELRELSRGIHPAILSAGGLRPAVRTLGRRCAIPVDMDIDVPTRLPDPVEVAAYYVVSEALANTVKHANATSAHVSVRASDDRLHLAIRDDGDGGATAGGGSGLVGLTDRVEAIGGSLTITSPPGRGTTLAVELPLDPAGQD